MGFYLTCVDSGSSQSSSESSDECLEEDGGRETSSDSSAVKAMSSQGWYFLWLEWNKKVEYIV